MDTGLGIDERNNSIPSVGRHHAVVVRFIRIRIGQSIERRGLGMRVLPRRMIMSIAAMDQLPVLGAAGMLDQEHMSTARTLENQRRQADQDANVPNH